MAEWHIPMGRPGRSWSIPSTRRSAGVPRDRDRRRRRRRIRRLRLGAGPRGGSRLTAQFARRRHHLISGHHRSVRSAIDVPGDDMPDPDIFEYINRLSAEEGGALLRRGGRRQRPQYRRPGSARDHQGRAGSMLRSAPPAPGPTRCRSGPERSRDPIRRCRRAVPAVGRSDASPDRVIRDAGDRSRRGTHEP